METIAKLRVVGNSYVITIPKALVDCGIVDFKNMVKVTIEGTDIPRKKAADKNEANISQDKQSIYFIC